MQETPVRFSRLGTFTGDGIGYPTPVFLGFPGGSTGKESDCNVGDLDLIPGLGRAQGTVTHSSIMTLRIPRTSLWSSKELGMTEQLSLSFFNNSSESVGLHSDGEFKYKQSTMPGDSAN